MDVAFVSLAVVHMLIWTFVLLAWVHPRLALVNLLVVIPGIYVLHVLPFHVLNDLKKRMHPRTWKRDTRDVAKAMVVPYAFERVRDTVFKSSFKNPLSPQGIMVFGAVTSAWAVLRGCRG